MCCKTTQDILEKLFSVLLKKSLKTLLGICYIFIERKGKKQNFGKGCTSYIPGMLSLSSSLFFSTFPAVNGI